MLRGRRAGIATALTVATVAAVTAGCGGGSSSTHRALALDPLAAAATKTQDAGPARISSTLAVGSPQFHGKTFRMRASGVVDGRDVELTFNLGSLLREVGIPSGMSDRATPAQIRHAKLKEIALEQGGDYVVYVRLGLLASQLPGGQHWIKVDVSKLGKSSGLDFGNLLSGNQLQPSDLLGMLTSEGKVQKLGAATIDGIATTKYRVILDVAKAIKAQGLKGRSLGTFAAQVPTIPEDVWVGKDGLVRRIRVDYGFAVSGKQVRVRMAIGFSDYGANVTIAAPPSGDVFDATQLAQSGIGNSLFH